MRATGQMDRDDEHPHEYGPEEESLSEAPIMSCEPWDRESRGELNHEQEDYEDREGERDPLQFPKRRTLLEMVGEGEDADGAAEEREQRDDEMDCAVPGEWQARDVGGERRQDHRTDRPDREEGDPAPEWSPAASFEPDRSDQGVQKHERERPAIDEVERHHEAERSDGEVTLRLRDGAVMGREQLGHHVEDEVQEDSTHHHPE